VALEAAFQELSSELRKLRDTLVALRLTVVEDKPLAGEAALVDHFDDTILEVMGLLEESLKRARVAQKEVESAADFNAVRRALAACQERFHTIEQRFSSDLVSYDKLKDLADLGSARKREWIPWASTVRQGIEECRAPLDAISKAIAACWQEIAERVGMTSVSVQTTNIGQKIFTRSGDRAELVHEGIT
jgi:hypothetical protein